MPTKQSDRWFAERRKRKLDRINSGSTGRSAANRTVTKLRKYEGKTREQWWVDKFPKSPVVYNAQYGRPRDVRTFIFDKSYILEDVVKSYKLKAENDTFTMRNILFLIMDRFYYVGDKESKDQIEYWQNPEDSITSGQGDCEDGAILIKSLSLVAGVPDWKVKIVAGMVEGGGHAYCTYIRDDDTQCILDWCYWPNKMRIVDRPTIANEPNYHSVWFSWTKEHTYGPHALEYRAGKIKEKTDLTFKF
jgi:transglutaminase-like putative cysteine protease